MATNLRIDPRRPWNDLMDTAKFGGTEKGGIKRLALSNEDKKVRDWFKAQCEALGCTVDIDEVGNMFAARPGASVIMRRNRRASMNVLLAPRFCSTLWLHMTKH